MGNFSTISVIIPVFNEARLIQRTLDHLDGLDGSDALEIIVVDGSRDRNTLQAVRHRRITALTAPRGRGIQMNTGARQATGAIFLFLHADTLLPPDALHRIGETCRRPGIAGGAFDLMIDDPGRIFRIIERTASLRSRLTRIPYGDQAIFLNRWCFERMGGYREIPIMEDVDLMRRIRQARREIMILPRKVRTSPRRWRKEGVYYTTLRNWMLVTLFLAGVSPERLARFYR